MDRIGTTADKTKKSMYDIVKLCRILYDNNRRGEGYV